MAKKNKLLNEPELIASVNWAIVSHLKPHQLAYRINEVCHWNLQRLRNLGAGGKTKAPGFALFNFQDHEMHPDFYLITLKDEQHLLVKDLKQFDFLLQARLPDEDTKWDPIGIMNSIKSIENVIGVFDINLDTVKASDVLYFDKQLDKLEVEKTVEKPIRNKRIVK